VTGGETLSFAGRLAWTLLTHLGLDTRIIDTEDAIAMLEMPEDSSTIVLSGISGNAYRDVYLQTHPNAIWFGADGSFELRDYSFKKPGTGECRH
jgi:hypothetical protein